MSFLSSRSRRADSMYPDGRSRKCSRVRPSTSDVTSSSGSEKAPSLFQSMHTSHLACIGWSLLCCVFERVTLTLALSRLRARLRERGTEARP